MADKKTLFITIFIFFLEIALSAQNINNTQKATALEGTQAEGNFYIQKSEEGEETFIQKLSWEYMDYVLRYEIELEKKIGEIFETIDLIVTEEPFLEVNLTHGEYRYRIHVYNLLDKLDSTSDWIEIIILKAELPEVHSFSPNIVYLDEDENIEFTVSGRNLQSDALYFFLPEDSNLMGKVVAQFIEVNDELTNVSFNISTSSFKQGQYTLHIKNPGGLESTLPGLQILYQRPHDFYISTGWAPALYVSPLFESIIGGEAKMLSFNATISAILLKKSSGFLGVEISGNSMIFNNEQEDYTASGFISNTDISFLYQFPIIKKKLFISAKIGAGSTFPHNIKYVYLNNASYPPISTMFINGSSGFALHYMITKHICVKTGLDYFLVFGNANQVGETGPNLFYPYINIGFKF